MYAAVTETTWIAIGAIGTFALAVATAAFTFAAFRQLPVLHQTQLDAARASDAAARAADAAEASVEIARKSSVEQSLAATFPMLDVSLSQLDDFLEVDVANRGLNPALDVDLIIFMEVHEEEAPLAQFVAERVLAAFQDTYAEVVPHDEEGWALRDHLLYTAIPSRRRVVADCPSPLLSESVHVLLQYRDVLGRNYCRLDWYFRSREGPERFHLAGDGRSQTVHAPRLNLEMEIDSSTEDTKLPTTLKAELDLNIEPYVIPMGFVREAGGGTVEDRGRWDDA
jgi:hypothetical protein